MRDWRSHLVLAAQSLSLLATGWVMWRLWGGPRSPAQPFGNVLETAILFTVLTWLWSAVVALLLHLAIRSVERVDVVGATLRTSAVAVWFAPATMLFTSISLWSIPAALVLVVHATRLLYAQWQQIHPAEQAPPLLIPFEAGMIGAGELPGPLMPRHLAPAMAVSFGVQAGMAAYLMLHPVLGAALLTMSAAVLTVFAISAGVWPQHRRPSLPRNIFALALTLILATGLSVVGVTGGRGWGFGGGGDGSGSIADLFKKGRAGSADEAQKKAPARDSGAGASKRAVPAHTEAASHVPGSFPGVILWPEIQPVTMLVEPLPAGGAGFATPAHPLSIPFGGEYWMYRWLTFQRPPPNSFFERGTPDHLSFATTDRWPLQMEAHQKLEQSIDVACCGKIRIEILNADRYPGTVSLELMLVDSQGQTTTRESLGLAPVLSAPDLKSDPVTAVAETLEFTLPGGGALQVFNELQVMFRRARNRADKSARVAIQRFILVPR